MISESVRNKVWQDLLDVARISLYFDALYRRYRLRAIISQVLLGVTGLGILSPLVGLIPKDFLEGVLGVCGLFVAGMAVNDLVFDPSGKKTVLRGIEQAMKMYETELRELWEEVRAGFGEDREALARSSEIMRKVHDSANALSLHTIKRLNEKCAEEAYKVEGHRYAA